jgi:hypothetical protein
MAGWAEVRGEKGDLVGGDYSSRRISSSSRARARRPPPPPRETKDAPAGAERASWRDGRARQQSTLTDLHLSHKSQLASPAETMDDPAGAGAAAVTCTYSASPAFLTSPEWANIRSAFRTAHLPLRNLHWKPVSRPSVRTIQKVDVELVPLDVQTLAARASTDTLAPGGSGGGGSGSRPASTRFSSSGVDGGDGSRSMVPRSLLERPVLNLYFVVCDVRPSGVCVLSLHVLTCLSGVSSRPARTTRRTRRRPAPSSRPGTRSSPTARARSGCSSMSSKQISPGVLAAAPVASLASAAASSTRCGATLTLASATGASSAAA